MKISKVLLVICCVFLQSCKESDQQSEYIYVDNKIIYQHSSPLELGFNEAKVENTVQEMEELGFVNSILVLADDRLIAENYFNNSSVNVAFNIKSVSKSILSQVVGVSISEGFLEGVDESAISFFPEYAEVNPDTFVNNIKVRHLLTMSSGFEYYENETQGVLYSDNWIRNALTQPFLFEPGKGYLYGTNQSHLISGIITKVSGESTYDFTKRALFNDLNIEIGQWDQDPQGYYFGGSELYISARSMVKFGELILNNGTNDGVEVIDSSWVAQSTTGKFSSFRGNIGPFDLQNYGYYWYLGVLGNKEVKLAWGFGGQFIIIIPEDEMVIVITSDYLSNELSTWEKSTLILGILEQNLMNAKKE